VRLSGLLAAVFAALAYGAGSVAQAAGVHEHGPTAGPGDHGPAARPSGHGAAADPADHPPTGATGEARDSLGAGVGRLVRSPLYLLGLAFDGLAFVGSLVALRVLPVFAVQSILATSLAVTVVLARLVLHATLRRVDVVAVAVAAVACAVTASAAGDGPATHPSRGAVLGACVAAAVLLAAGLLAVRRRAASSVLALVSGTAFSVQVLAARGLSLPGFSVRRPGHDLAVVAGQPLAWALVVAGGTGIVLYGLALERGGVAAATAIVWVVEIVVPTVCGLALLGDVVRPGWDVPLVAALVAATAAAVVLARSPAQV